MRIPSIEPDYDGIYRKMVAEIVCKHAQTTVRKKLAADGAISIWHQCHKCGSKIGPAIRKATLTPQQLEALPLWDGEIEKRFYKDREKHHHQMLDRERERCRTEWWRHYNAYLETPEWKRKRQLVLLRAQGVCEGCREAEAVQVHHLSYSDVGEEFLFQLAAMCRKCHERWHDLLEHSVSATPQPPVDASLLQSTRGGGQ